MLQVTPSAVSHKVRLLFYPMPHRSAYHAVVHRKNTAPSTPSMAYAPMPPQKFRTVSKALSPPSRSTSTTVKRSNNSATAA